MFNKLKNIKDLKKQGKKMQDELATVIHEGSAAWGKVKIVVDSEIGTLELAELGVGQCLGDTAVIGIQKHTASAIAVEDTELVVLSRSDLLSIYDHDKQLFGLLMMNIAREACRRLQHADEVLLHYVLSKPH